MCNSRELLLEFRSVLQQQIAGLFRACLCACVLVRDDVGVLYR
jgi:hypothetical protein